MTEGDLEVLEMFAAASSDLLPAMLGESARSLDVEFVSRAKTGILDLACVARGQLATIDRLEKLCAQRNRERLTAEAALRTSRSDVLRLRKELDELAALRKA